MAGQLEPVSVANIVGTAVSQTVAVPATSTAVLIANLSPNYVAYVKFGATADFSTSTAIPPNGQVELTISTETQISAIGAGALLNMTFGK